MPCLEAHDRLGQCDLVEDEVVARIVDDFLVVRAFRREGICDVIDAAGRLYSAPRRADVFHRAVVQNGGEGSVRIGGKLNDLFIVLEGCEADTVLLRHVVEIHDADMRQPAGRRRERNLAVFAHHALECTPDVYFLLPFCFPLVPLTCFCSYSPDVC